MPRKSKRDVFLSHRTDPLRIVAAEGYAERKHMSVHEAMESAEFQDRWNYFQKHPNNKAARAKVGLTRELQKEGEEEENSFCVISDVWGYAVDIVGGAEEWVQQIYSRYIISLMI